MSTLSVSVVFIIGLMIGGAGGVMAMCLVMMAREDDDNAEEARHD